MNLELQALACRAWDHFLETRSSSHAVKPSMPILYFGDSHRYSTSPIRVVTVGLNPSREEFPKAQPWSRFPGLIPFDHRPEIDAYLRALDAYYGPTAYMRWFNSYERVLAGIEASYHPGANNTALHTDVCSVLATDPTWSGLDDDHKDELEDHGAELWRALIQCLRPHVIIASVAERHLEKMGLQGSPRILHEIRRKNPYSVSLHEVSIGTYRSLLVFGRAANTPFGTVSDEDKRHIGASIASAIKSQL